MRGGKILFVMGFVGATAFVGHGALDAFADQKATDVIESIKQRLPERSELSYSSIDGDPYATGVTIEGLIYRDPVWGSSTIDVVELSGAKLDETGKLSEIGDISISNLSADTGNRFDISFTSLNATSIKGDGLKALVEGNGSLADLRALDFDTLAIKGIVLEEADGHISIGSLDFHHQDVNRSIAKFSNSKLHIPSEDGQMTIEHFAWTGTLPQADAPLPDLDNPASVMALLPTDFIVEGLSIQTEGGQAGIPKMTSSVTQDGDYRITADYAIEDAMISSNSWGNALGDGLDISGRTGIDLQTQITDGRFEVRGSSLADADIDFELRGVEFMPGLLLGAPTPATSSAAPAIISFNLDYRDHGIMDQIFDRIAGPTPEVRNQLADQAVFLGSTLFGGKIPAAFDPIIQEAREFLIDPSRLSIDLAPKAPVDVASLTLAAFVNPAGLPELLGLSLQANP